MESIKQRSILADFDFTIEHCNPQHANMSITQCEHLSLSEILSKYRMQICVSKKKKADPVDLTNVFHSHGTKLLDAALYSKLPESMQPKAIMVNEEQLCQLANRHTTERYIFILYFYLLTEGRIPNESDALPPVLRQLLMTDKRPIDICRDLASFSLSQLAHPWIRDLSNILDAKIIHLILPCISGYRTMIPFSKYKIVKMVPIQILEAAMAVRKFCERGPVWDMHPLSLTPAFHTVSGGNFYQNLINLIYEVYTPPQIVDMMKYRMIPANALPNEHYRQYTKWTDSVFELFTDSVFSKRMITHTQ
ncbi:hypothetical protein K501DRAFT_269543 [Backusella circina FSU 941]|nr:hypothetical protein K501DRAFT_269543 [Backusella circina FSU 941]